tara:strand:+ start:975 stop:5219 length:4245 start_codon:yes stop_codon:yes gene_type:complete
MAGKKYDGGTIELKTTDGGSFKVTEKEAKRLAKQIDKLGGASQSTDRRIKGVTQQSSNATKNFSKQAQTMQGGIVAVYATIAAQVFAVSAAYQFLKSSFETRNLIEGQKQFGAVTGVAYQSITKNVQEATGGMLQFKEAASGVAIGIAAGLSAGALEKLGEAAKNASLALGRDVTDSFNRLIRGVTKAEPELLDELGIVLRLENATTKYGVAIGKSKDQLNAFERTQAVLNDVLEQAEQKYKIIGQVMDPEAFALGQLTKEIDELMMSFQVFIAEGLMPIINFFKNNAAALVAAMGLFVLPIIKSLLPDLNKGMENSQRRMEMASEKMKESWAEATDSMRAAKMAVDNPEAARKGSAGGLRDLGVKSFKGGDDQLNARQIAAYKRHMRDKTGIYKKFNTQERAAFRRHLLQQEQTLKISTQKGVTIVQKGEYQKRAAWAASDAIFAAGEAAKQKAMSFTAKWGARLFRAMGWLGVLAMLYQGVKSMVNWFRDLDEEEKKLREETDKLNDKLGTLNEELERMGTVRTAHANLLSLKMSVEQLGSALQSTDLVQKIKEYNNELQKGNDENDEVIISFIKMAKNLAIMNPQFEDLVERMENGETITDIMIRQWTHLSSGMINASNAAKQFTANQQSLNKSIDDAVGKFGKLPYQDLGKNLAASRQGIRDALGILSPDQLTTIEGGQEYKTIGADGMSAKGNQVPPAIMALIGDRKDISSEFGFFAETAIRSVERAGKAMEAHKLFDEEYGMADTAAGTGKIGSLAGGGRVDIWKKDRFGEITDLKSVGEIELELGRKMQKHEREMYDLRVKSWTKRNETLEELDKQAKEDVINAQLYISALREQDAIAEDITKLQTMGLTLQKKQVGAAKQLAAAGYNKTLKLEVQQYQSMLKIEEKKKNEQAARVAILNAEQKIRTQLLNNEKKMTEQGLTQKELENMSKEDLSSLIDDLMKKGVIESESLVNADNALDLAITETEMQRLLTILEQDKLDIQIQVLKVQEELTRSVKAAAKAARDYKNQMADAALTMKVGGTGAAKGTYRRTRIGQLKALTGQTTEEGVESYNQRAKAIMQEANALKVLDHTKTTYDESGSVMNAVYSDTLVGAGTGADGQHIGTNLTPGQIQYNKYLQDVLKLNQQNTDATRELTDLQNEEGGLYIMGQVAGKREIAQIDKETIATINPASKLYWEIIKAAKLLDIELTKEQKDLLQSHSEEITKLSIATELQTGIAQTMENAFVSAFQSMVDGSKSFGGAMKDLAVSVLRDLAAMFAKAAALQAIMWMFPGMGSGTGVMSKFFNNASGTGRYGGEFSRSGKGYAYGGIAQGPNSGYMATLHGREAVVPLGNDRSIPVDLRGAGGNTVNVSVTMNGQQSNTQAQGGGPNMQALGKSIGGLVQQHLQQEMRPGGLLNSQGAKGRNR